MKDTQTIRREAIIAAILAAVVALAYLLFTPPFWLAEEPLIAAHIARGHGFLSPLLATADAIPTAMSPPGYPYLMAGVYKIFGIESHASLNVMLGINVLSAALVAAGIYTLTARCFNLRAARWATGLFLLNPVFGRAATVLWHTYPVLAVLIWTLVWCLEMNEKRSATWLPMAGLGVTLGIMALASPTVVLAYPLLVTFAIGKTSWGRWLGLSVACFAAFCVTLAPWTIRGYEVFGRIFFVRNNFPLEIWVGNQPGTNGTQTFMNHPSNDPVERERLLAMGENRYFDQCWKMFTAHYHEDPLTYWRLTLRRSGILFVDPYEDKRFRAIRMGVDGLFVALGVAGMVLAWRSRRGPVAPFAILFLCSFPYIFTQINPSYALPVRMILIIYGGVAVAALVDSFSKRPVEAGGGIRARA